MSTEELTRTRRPDGTLRPAVRVRAGYVPPEEQVKFTNKWKGEDDDPLAGVPGGGSVDPAILEAKISKTAQKNKKRNDKDRIQKTEDGAAVEPECDDVNGAEPAPAPALAPDAAAAAGEPSEVEKKIKALKKRLRQVEELEERLMNGATLNQDQAAKVASKESMLGGHARAPVFTIPTTTPTFPDMRPTAIEASKGRATVDERETPGKRELKATKPYTTRKKRPTTPKLHNTHTRITSTRAASTLVAPHWTAHHSRSCRRFLASRCRHAADSPVPPTGIRVILCLAFFYFLTFSIRFCVSLSPLPPAVVIRRYLPPASLEQRNNALTLAHAQTILYTSN